MCSSDLLSRLVEALLELEAEPDNGPLRKKAAGLLARQGLATAALELARRAPSEDQTELLLLLFLSGEPGRALGLLQEKARAGPLAPLEALLLAAGRYQAGDLQGALNALERNPAPAPGEPLAPLWDAFKGQLLDLAAAARKLEAPGR